jgi:hypothetical protein
MEVMKVTTAKDKRSKQKHEHKRNRFLEQRRSGRGGCAAETQAQGQESQDCKESGRAEASKAKEDRTNKKSEGSP